MTPLLVRAARREPVERTPVWFMRQAGRTLPGYRAIRKRHDLFEVCRRPELCAQVTLEPVEAHGVDAAVMFADIMLPVIGMGVDVQLVENVGPVIDRPIESLDDVRALRVPEPEDAVPFVLEAVRIVRESLVPDRALVGFCGGPFTVAGYLIEGKPTREFAKTKACMFGSPEVWHELMERLSETFLRYVRAKVEAGADAIQLFDSWVGALTVEDYEEFVAPYSERILGGLSVPTIHFGTGTSHLLESMAAAGGDVIGLDWRIPLGEGWERVGSDRGVQGNLDPALLLGSWDRVERATDAILEAAGGRPGHIFNLGHGVLPSTDPGSAAPPSRARARADGRRSRLTDAVVLMAYGSPSSPEDIRPYLEDIREGRPVSDEAVEELTERYRRIGGRSPLDEITERQRAALERELGIPVHLGMKHWRPRIGEAADRAVEGGATRVLGLVLAPHYSRLSIAGYRERLEAGLAGRAELVFVESWHDHEPFLDVLADRVRGTDAHVVFTAHSLPERILAMGDPYKDELLRTSELVARPGRARRLVVRVPERERDRRALARPGHRRPPGRPVRARRPQGARGPGRLRLRPSRDPLGHRRRSAREGRRARPRTRPDRVAERRPGVHRRSRLTRP